MAQRPSKARILTCYYRPKPGGFCRRLFQAIEALLVDGHTVHYVSVVAFPINHPRCVHHRFRWPPSKTSGLWFWACFHVFTPMVLLYLAVKFRITHAFAFGHTYGFLLQPVRMICRRPLSIFLRADVMENHRLKQHPHWLIRLDRLLEGAAIHKAHVYCVSKSLAQRVRASRRFARPIFIEVLPNAVPTLSTVPKQGPMVLPLRLSSAGILEERKNQALLVEMMGFIGGDQARLSIYGTGPQAEWLANLSRKLGLEQKITFKGWTDEAHEIWANTDLFLFPSKHEGSPNAVLEAIAAGIPVLASDIPEHREILPPFSLLPVNGVHAWVQALTNIIADPSRQLIVLRDLQNRTVAPLRFDWEKTIVAAILDENRLEVAKGSAP